jgi:hypothetical protein
LIIGEKGAHGKCQVPRAARTMPSINIRAHRHHVSIPGCRFRLFFKNPRFGMKRS